MMKFLKFIFIAIVSLILIVGVAVYFFLRTFNIGAYKPRIMQEISNALNRDVHFEDIMLTFAVDRGISLAVTGLRILDDPAFSRENFLTVRELNFGVDFKTLLTHRQIRVTGVTIGSPRVVIIRDGEGAVNAATIGKKRHELEAATIPLQRGVAYAQTVGGDATANRLLTQFSVDAITVRNGVIVFIDRSFPEPLTVELNSVIASVRDFSLGQQSPFSFQASLFSALRRNINLDGLLVFDSDNQAVALYATTVDIDMSGIGAGQVVAAVPALAEAGLEGRIDGKIKSTIDEMVVTSDGLQALSSSGSLSDGKIRLAYLSVPLSPINAVFELTHQEAAITRSSLGMGAGTVEVTGRITDPLNEQKFAANIVFDKIDVGEVVPQKGQETKLYGTLRGAFDVTGVGLGCKAIDTSSGKGSIEIVDARLANMNVLKLVLSRISIIPNLVEKIEVHLPEKHKEQLKQQDTSIERIDIAAAVKDSALIVNKAHVIADAFALSGTGTIRFDQAMSLNASVTIPRDLSDSFIAGAEELRFLTNRTGEIVIPVTVLGTVTAPRFVPDIEYLAKKILADKGRDELRRVLDRALGRGQEPDAVTAEGAAAEGAQAPGESTEPHGQEQKRSPERQLIDSLLDKIFK